MKSKNINIILKIALISLILYSASIGCAGSLPEVEVQHISKYKTFQNQNGVSIAIDPFFEEKRLNKFFGTDVLSGDDILPVHIIIENNMDQPILILRENILLLNANKEIIQKPSTNPAEPVEKRRRAMVKTSYLASGEVIGAVGGVGGVGVGLVGVLGGSLAMRYANIEMNIKTKSFYEKTINNKGELHHGFVYFILKDLPILDNNAKIQVTAKNINSEAITTFVFDVKMADIIEEIKLRKEEESKNKP